MIGDASCLDAAVFRGLMHCATRKLGGCDMPKGLVPGLSVAGAQKIRSHAELHGLLDGIAIDETGKRVVELAIEDPQPGWRNGDCRTTEIDYWAGLAHDVPRFDNWARTKSREVKAGLEVVVRPAQLSEVALREWQAEKPLSGGEERTANSGIKGKSKVKEQKISRSEGELIETEEWVERWMDEGRSRAVFKAELENARFGSW